MWNSRCFIRAVVVAILTVGLFGGELRALEAKVLPDPIPRIAVVGDSWGMFLWWFRSFKKALQELGFDRYIEVANESVVGGGKTFQFVNEEQFPPATAIRASISRMLEEFPTIDVVVISLGGNDVLYGTEYVLPEDPLKSVRAQCPGHPEDYNAILLDKIINNDLQNIVDYILAIRPDIRVLLMSYDYGGEMKRRECSLEIQQLGIMAMDVYKQRIADANDRVFFCNNYGLMQYTYGVYEYQLDSDNKPIPESGVLALPPGTVKDGYSADDYPPLRLPNPDDIFVQPWTEGGNPALLPGYPDQYSPLFSLLDMNMHLSEDGYNVMAKRMVERMIGEWLNYPKAFEIDPIEDAKAVQYEFQVTFSEAVTGVDASDFEVATAVLNTKGLDISEAEVVDVAPSDGFHDVYTVTVDMNPGAKAEGDWEEVVHIHVLDDDSIVDASGDPLGGPNTTQWTDNGKFTYCGPFAFADLELPEPGNFDEVLDFFNVVTKPYLHFINYAISFASDVLDINGDLTPLVQALLNDDDIDVNNLYIKGNGILESYEFGLIERCLKDPGIDNSAHGGISHEIAVEAWEHNLALMQNNLGGLPTPEDDNMILRVFSGIDTLLAAYMTLGEQEMCLALAFASIALQSEDVAQFLPGIEFQTVLPDNYIRLPQFLGGIDTSGDEVIQIDEFGDADGDGYNNAEEFLYFECDGKDAFVDAALDFCKRPKAIHPVYVTGEPLRLYVPEMLHVAKTTYQWYKDSTPIENGSSITGTNSRTLNIVSLALADSGSYTCVYNENRPEGMKSADITYGPIDIVVAEGIPGEGEGECEGEGEGEGAEGEGEGDRKSVV